MTPAEYVRECNKVLATGDVDLCVAFLLKHNPTMQPPSSRHVAEMMMHKARTGSTSLPMELRRASKQWLLARGYSSLDDGDV